MAALPPAVAAVRTAVRRALADLAPGEPVLVACSGGADSLALAAATAFVAPRLGRPAGLGTVDHGLQSGSDRRAAHIARWAQQAGLAPVRVLRVRVDGRPGGPEAAARQARYQALAQAARQVGAAAVLLGHTMDDQAETVLLALARGSGPRGLAGMPARRDIDGVAFLRPLLEVRREQTRQACADDGLDPWDDPHNTDPAYARARVRAEALPALCRALGPAVVDNLARTAALLAQDNEILDELTVGALAAARTGDGVAVPALAGLAAGLRTRVLRAWVRGLGVPPAALSRRHLMAIDALLTDWHGQGTVSLPGAIHVERRGSILRRARPGDGAAVGTTDPAGVPASAADGAGLPASRADGAGVPASAATADGRPAG